MARTESIREALRKVMAYTGRSESSFHDEIWADSEFFFMSSDGQPEGTPSYLFSMKTGNIEQRTIAQLNEVNAWIESPGTQLVRIRR